MKRQLLRLNHLHSSFAQEGEDKILEKYFGEFRHEGIFVDVGCNHPYNYSNTYKFYLKGWRGVNIDARPGTKALFEKVRPDDVTIEAGVSIDHAVLDYHILEHDLLNTFDRGTAEAHAKEFKVRILKTLPIETWPLKDLLDRVDLLKQGRQPIDFMSVDVEGLDLQVLRSNDWERYTPEVILVEALGTTYEECGQTEIARFLATKGYYIFAKTFNTVFFSKNRERFTRS